VVNVPTHLYETSFILAPFYLTHEIDVAAWVRATYPSVMPLKPLLPSVSYRTYPLPYNEVVGRSKCRIKHHPDNINKF
jgi:hypothetical protein